MPFGIANCSKSCTLYERAIAMATLDSVLEPLERIEIVLPPSSDTREIFRQVAQVYEGRKVELTEDGHIIVMAPTGLEGGYLSGEVYRQLANWAIANKRGKAFDSSAGFYITPTQNRSPDAAWVKNERIESIPKKQRKAFAPFCPDFAIEVKSPSDDLSELQSKCLLMSNAAQGRPGSLIRNGGPCGFTLQVLISRLSCATSIQCNRQAHWRHSFLI
jgi:Uma2 family endonuclease